MGWMEKVCAMVRMEKVCMLLLYMHTTPYTSLFATRNHRDLVATLQIQKVCMFRACVGGE